VTLTASAAPSAEPEPEPEPEPVAEAPSRPEEAPRASRWSRFLRRRPEAVAPAEPEQAEPEQAEPEQAAEDTDDIVAKLGAVLDDLGAAHHRPFSR
jgi:hypothetical protein